MAMRTNSVRATMTANLDSFRNMTASAIRAKLNTEYGFNLGSDGQIPSLIKEFYGDTVKAKSSDSKENHFNGYSHSLSSQFVTAYKGYREVNDSAPIMSDSFSQITTEVKDYIASICEDKIFNSFLKTANCREPSKDYALLGIKTLAMQQAEQAEIEAKNKDTASKISCLENQGYLVFNPTSLPKFNFADLAVNHFDTFQAKVKELETAIAELGKVKKSLESLEVKLNKAVNEESKAELSSRISEAREENAKLEQGITSKGKGLINLEALIKSNAEKADHYAKAVKLICCDDFISRASEASQHAMDLAQQAHDVVNKLVDTAKETAPSVIDHEFEAKIKTLVDFAGMTREEAIAKLRK